jgi:hypothetical protein
MEKEELKVSNESKKRLEERKSQLFASKKGEPTLDPKYLVLGKMALGKDGKLWVVSIKEKVFDEETGKEVILKKWQHF